MDLVSFLTARLDEDECAARAATPGPWRFTISGWVSPENYANILFTHNDPDGQHAARHDPARVLREVEAKRAIVGLAREAQQRMMDGPDLHKDGTFHTVSAWMRTALVHLAAAYSDHPDYAEAVGRA